MQKSLTELVGSTQYPMAIATLMASRQNELARELYGLTPALAGDHSIACDGSRGQPGAKYATEGSMTRLTGTCISAETLDAGDSGVTFASFTCMFTETLNATDTAFTHYGSFPCSIS